MDVQRAIRAPFLDAKWFVKSLWGMLWTGLVVTAPAVSGYMLDYIRNVAQNYETPLPEWNREFGRWWVRGLLVIVAGFIYTLPATVLLLVGLLPLIGAIVMSGGSSAGLNAAIASGIGSVCLTSFLAVVWIVAVSIFFWGAEVNFALSNDFGALFRFKEIMARLRTPGAGYFGAWGMAIVISIVTGAISGIIGGIIGGIFGSNSNSTVQFISGFVGGWFGFLGALMTSHLFGQYAAKAYGYAGMTPAPAGYATPYAAAPVPPAPPAPPAGYAAQAAPQPPGPPMPPVAPEPPVPPVPPAAPVAETPEVPAHPASSAAAPDSPIPPSPSGDAEPPSGPNADPPAGDGGA